ncbi:MAG: DUF3800 domain-containing protein [Cyanobacteria bacterium P01_A01_bin.37]
MPVSSPEAISPNQVQKSPSHVAFADESKYNIGRYRGLGAVSLRYADFPKVKADLQKLIADSGITEFKWKKMGGADKRFAARKLLQYAVEQVHQGVLRIDVLTWDTHDARHDIRGRDDLANLQRMYHHLLKNVMRERWPSNSTWLLCPDEFASMPWGEVASFLQKVSYKVSTTPNLLEPQRWIDLQQKFHISEIRACDSKQTPLIQLADLLTGLCVYSRTEYEIYEQWLTANEPQMSLFASMQNHELKLSRAHRDRCPLLKEFSDLCKHYKLGVSLKRQRGLRTPNPKNPMNFWWYIPQHEYDKAPIRAAS